MRVQPGGIIITIWDSSDKHNVLLVEDKGEKCLLRIKPLGIDAKGLGFYCWSGKR